MSERFARQTTLDGSAKPPHVAGAMCPYCRKNAPIVYQGVAAYCSACGKPRPPLIAPSVSHAGKPSKVGGTVAGVAGWIVLAMGVSVALFFGLVLGSIFSATVGLAFGLLFGIPALVTSLVLLLSGKALRKSGEDKLRETRRRAIFALAENRGGTVNAYVASESLGVSPAEADAFLTDLAKTGPEDVTVELDDQGGIYYAFPKLQSASVGQRFEDPSGSAAPRARVEGVDFEAAEAAQAEEEADAAPYVQKQRR